MLLIDAIFIHNGGGRVLLEYLVMELEKTDYRVFYLFDERIDKSIFKIKSSNQYLFQKASLISRHQFYKKYGSSFSKFFILGNIPPTVKLSAQVISYFHNAIYLEVPADFSFIEKLKYRLKKSIITIFEKNVNIWLTQSEFIKKQFAEKYSNLDKVKSLPFFPSLGQVDGSHTKGSFLYVSNAQANKNHKRLIDAFCKSYDNLKQGKLTVTVNDSFPEIVKYIEKAVTNGYPIENVGFLSREALSKKYADSEYIVFPSVSESFGLGIIEGIHMGCKVIGSDLPYLHAVCTPSSVFNPYNVKNIADTISYAISNILNPSTTSVRDEMKELLLFLNPN